MQEEMCRSVRYVYINEKQRMAAVLLLSGYEEMAVLCTSI